MLNVFKEYLWDWRLYYLAVFFIPLIVNPWGFGPYEIPKQVFFVLIMAFVGMYFVLNKIIARKGLNLTINVPVILGVFWLLSIFLSGLLGISPYESWWGSTERLQGAWSWILYIVHFFICLHIFKKPIFRQMFFKVAIYVGIILSLYAILQQIGIDPLGISNIDEASGRSFATIGQPNFLGQILIFPIVILLTLIFKEKQSFRKRILFTACLLFIVIGLITTANKASIFALTFTISLLAIYKAPARIRLRLILGTLVLITLTVFVFWEMGNLRSLNSRLSLLKPVHSLLIENPILGNGPETMYRSYQKVITKDIYLTENLYDIPDRIHNETVQIFLDQGLAGLMVYLFLIGFLFYLFLRRKIRTHDQMAAFFSIAAYMVSVQFSFSMSSQMVFLLAMWAVLLMGNESNKSFFADRIFKISPIMVTWTLKPVVLLICFFYLRSSFGLLYADNLFANGMGSYLFDTARSAAFFDEVLKFNPNSRYYLYHITNLLADGLREDNDINLKKFLENNLLQLKKITGNGYHFNLAMANYQSKIGNSNEADKYFTSASLQAPNWPMIWQKWGDSLFQTSDYNNAISKYEKLLTLAPQYWKWSIRLDELNIAEKEQHRLFRKNHSTFYDGLLRLLACYEIIGDYKKAEELKMYILSA